MKEYNTKYGTLYGVNSVELYPNGNLKECILDRENTIGTIFGEFIPQFQHDEVRRKYSSSLSFYKNGNIKVINLNKQTDITTKTGKFSIEKVTFYETGEIKRIFHLNGKISGYWSEENEFDLAKEYEFNLGFVTIKSKFMIIQLYKNEKIKSISFWPGEKVKIESPVGIFHIKVGISLYENGALKSCETQKPIEIETAIGRILAYDASALGIHGENNSLSFFEDGNVKSIITSTDCIEITGESGENIKYHPTEKTNLFNNNIKDIVPLKIDFDYDKVRICGNEYEINKYKFKIINNYKRIRIKDKSCSSCEFSNQGIQIKI